MRPYRPRRGLVTALICTLGWTAALSANGPAPDHSGAVGELLRKRCESCHGPKVRKAGLRLDRKADALRGGDSGPAIVPGKPGESPLLERVTSREESERMPPKGPPLNEDEVKALRDWIAGGASWSDEGGSASTATAEAHWSFLPIVEPQPPGVKDARWARNPIDRFVLANLESKGVRPSPEADRATLLRRLHLDITGLPPTPEQVDAFLADSRPDAYERVVDQLLASPHYAERWARHWLDLARYADSDGYEKDLPRPYAYRFRDWVIDAVGRDMPFDRFTIEQLAGDLMPDATPATRLATAFHRNTLTNREGGVDPEEDRVKNTVDRANTTGTVWLGLTVGCAQCHSHKYDPISQQDYYRLFAFFNRAVEKDEATPKPGEVEAHRKALKKFLREQSQWQEAIRADEHNGRPIRQAAWEASWRLPKGEPTEVDRILATPRAERTQSQLATLADAHRKLDPTHSALTKQLAALEKAAPKEDFHRQPTLVENPKPPVTHLLVRGDFLRPGIVVEPGVPSALPTLATRGKVADRLDLARWIVSPGNPLAARVAANRVWQHLFAKGLVGTPEDFGTKGEPPTHPGLLDWLAVSFRTSGWSQKSLIRTIVTSSTYRQSSHPRPDLADRDPLNRWLARQDRIRLEAETVRDLALSASGLLDRSVGGPSVRPPLPSGVAELGYAGSVKWVESPGTAKYRRGLYIFHQRTVPYPMLSTFDAPEGTVTCTRRERSNTPLQALTLMNDPVFIDAARALGRRVMGQGSDDAERARYALRLAVGRVPSEAEVAKLAALVGTLKARFKADAAGARALAGVKGDATDLAAWTVAGRVTLNLDEFYMRE